MPFVTPLRVELINHVANQGQGEWKLLEPLVFIDLGGNKHVVPAGFCTDFASTPRRPFAYLLAGCTAHAAAVLHDWLIRAAVCAREDADLLFAQAMESVGMPAWRVGLMYNAVRAETENIANRPKPWGDV